MVPWGLVSAGDGFIIRVHKEFFFIIYFILFQAAFLAFFTTVVCSTLVTSNKGENSFLIILFLVCGNYPGFSVSFANFLNSGVFFLKFVLYLCLDACPYFLLNCSRLYMLLLETPF